MKELIQTPEYTVSEIQFSANDYMRRHVVDREAFLIVESGDALLIYRNEKYELKAGVKLPIPANEPHLLKIITDFKAMLILGTGTCLSYIDPAREQL